jgi:hypothetical protein
MQAELVVQFEQTIRWQCQLGSGSVVGILSEWNHGIQSIVPTSQLNDHQHLFILRSSGIGGCSQPIRYCSLNSDGGGPQQRSGMPLAAVQVVRSMNWAGYPMGHLGLLQLRFSLKLENGMSRPLADPLNL